MDKNECESCGQDGIKEYIYSVGELARYCAKCAAENGLSEAHLLRLPVGYSIIKTDVLTDARKDGAAVENRLAHYETKFKQHRHFLTMDERLIHVVQHLEQRAVREISDNDQLRKRVVEHLLGQRILINMVLNGDWTHSQKNNTIQALGELVQTGIENLRKERQCNFGSYSIDDPFTPTWTLAGQYRARVDAEEEADKLRKELAELRGSMPIDEGEIDVE